MSVRTTLLAATLLVGVVAGCSDDDDAATTSSIVDVSTSTGSTVGDSNEVTTTSDGTDTTPGESTEISLEPGETVVPETVPPTVVDDSGDRPDGIPEDIPLPDAELRRSVKSPSSFALNYEVDDAEDALVEYHGALTEDDWETSDILQGASEPFNASFTATKGDVTLNVTGGDKLSTDGPTVLVSIVGL